jgi:NAD(P)-dependent dehydrogenase (short-subunit alcohol dehydrogenase family)
MSRIQASIHAAVDTVLERFGRIDVLVNNAGFALRGAVEEVDVSVQLRACLTLTSWGSSAWFRLSLQSCESSALAES